MPARSCPLLPRSPPASVSPLPLQAAKRPLAPSYQSIVFVAVTTRHCALPFPLFASLSSYTYSLDKRPLAVIHYRRRLWPPLARLLFRISICRCLLSFGLTKKKIKARMCLSHIARSRILSSTNTSRLVPRAFLFASTPTSFLPRIQLPASNSPSQLHTCSLTSTSKLHTGGSHTRRPRTLASRRVSVTSWPSIACQHRNNHNQTDAVEEMETVNTGARLEALRKLMVENKIDIYGMASYSKFTQERG